MLKSVQVWVNDATSKQYSITPTSTCEDIIKYLAEQYNIPKRAAVHLELHVVHNGKDYSHVQREEKMMKHLQTLADAGLRIDETNHKNKYVLVVNHDAVKKAQKLSGHTKSSWSPLSYFKKRSGIGHQRSVSLPSSSGVPEDSAPPRAVGLSSSSNALLKSRPPDSILEAEKMPSTPPTSGAPHLTPRGEIDPPRAGFRARSKTISPSLSSSDLRNQEALNQMITQRIKNRASLGYDRPPLADASGEFIDQNSPRAGNAPLNPFVNTTTSSVRSSSPPPPQRLFEPPPSIVHLSPSTSSSSISIASASLPATAPRQRSLTTSGVIGNRLTPPRSQFAEMTLGSTGAPATWRHDSFGDQSPPLTSSSAPPVSTTTSAAHQKVEDEHLELLAVVELLKKAT